jgi:aminoglycoside phosphotransferase (APT) family kinase protein
VKFSNAELCECIKTIVAQTILPNLGNPESQAAAVAISTAMDELIKRDLSTPALLADLVPEGRAISREILDRLTELGLQEATLLRRQLDDFDVIADNGLEGLAQRYNLLLKMMEVGCKALHEAGDRFPEHKRAIQRVIDQAGRWDLAYVLRQQAAVAETQPSNASTQSLTGEKLQAFLEGAMVEGQGIRVSGFQRVPGGMSKQTYFFTLTDRSGSEDLVVRKANNAQLLDLGCLNIKREYYLLKDVYAAGFPCPEPLLFADEPAGTDGSYFIMRKAPGKLLGSFFGANQMIPEGLLMHLAETFARLHAIPMEQFAPNIAQYSDSKYIGCTVEQALRYNLDAFYVFWRSLERLPSPMEIRTLDWLRDNIPRNSNPVVLTHNDLLIHNFLADGERIASVLDWEGANFGDPASDLGYVKAEVSKHMDWGRFLAHYRAHGGQPIDESAFAYHETITNLRNLVGTNKHTTTIKTGRGDPKDILLTYNYVPVFMSIIDRNIGGGK